MYESKSTVKVRIAGQDYVLRSGAEAEYTERCAKFLDDRVAEVQSLSRVPDTHRAVVLAALSVTDEYFRTVSELEALKADVAERSGVLAARLEAAIEAPGPAP